jgi:hypothetical protein
MNPQNSFAPDSVSQAVPGSVEETLRLIANLPVPAGLEDRIHAGLRASKLTHKARVLAWPGRLRPASHWMHSAVVRGAAAAAIVCVVAGGGWGIYSSVRPHAPARAIVVAPHPAVSGGFASGGAMRTPQTLNGPVLTHPANGAPSAAKAPARAAQKARRTRQAADGGNAATQPSTPIAK